MLSLAPKEGWVMSSYASAVARFQPLIGTLAYVWDREDDRILVIRRDARTDDDHFGKINGLGGKVEPDEDLVSSMEREVFEEAGLTVTKRQLRGTITFTDFGPRREQWLVVVFLVTDWRGVPTVPNDAEGSLEWVSRADLLAICEPSPEPELVARYPMWAGDRNFVPLVFDDGPAFHATMPYDQDLPLRWMVRRDAGM